MGIGNYGACLSGGVVHAIGSSGGMKIVAVYDRAYYVPYLGLEVQYCSYSLPSISIVYFI